MFRDTHHNKPCKYCLRPMDRAYAPLHATRDHVLPRSRGGGAKGTVISCATCNGIKGDMTPEAWLQFMAEHPRWWTLTKLQLRDIRRKALGLPPRRVKMRAIRQIKRFGRVVATVAPSQIALGETK